MAQVHLGLPVREYVAINGVYDLSTGFAREFLHHRKQAGLGAP
jgi:hypothetical protein